MNHRKYFFMLLSGVISLSANAELADGVYRIVNHHSSKSLETSGRSNSNSASVQQWDAVPHLWQQWVIEKQGTSSDYKISNYGSRLVLSVTNNSNNKGALIQQNEWDSTNQHHLWNLTENSDGTYQISNKGSSKVLEIPGGSTTNGQSAGQWDAVANSSAWQTWDISQAWKNDHHWLYFGWQGDYPKSWAWRSGAVAPGGGSYDSQRNYSVGPIFYHLEYDGELHIPNGFDDSIEWSVLDNYYPSPVSKMAMPSDISMTIEHFANRVTTGVTAVYSRVSLKNDASSSKNIVLHVSADNTEEIPLTSTHTSSTSANGKASYTFTVPANGEKVIDFVAQSNGTALTVAELTNQGSFATNQTEMKTYWDNKLSTLSKLTEAPYSSENQLPTLYKHSLIMLWQSIVEVGGNYELRGSSGAPMTGYRMPNGNGFPTYDTVFNHDLPNMVVTLLLAGDVTVAKKIMEGPKYQSLTNASPGQGYYDSLPKFIIPYANLLETYHQTGYVTDRFETIKTAAHRTADLFDSANGGIISASNTLDTNYFGSKSHKHVLVDNFAALHGLKAYAYIAWKLGNTTELGWANTQISNLNTGLNTTIDNWKNAKSVDYYMVDMIATEDAFFGGGYQGNWIGTSLMMSQFPWSAKMKGFDLSGTWDTLFDKSIDEAVRKKDTFSNSVGATIPNFSWGGWWGYEYGSVYNAGMSIPMLYSDKHRRRVIPHLKWLIENETAPLQWGESFSEQASSTATVSTGYTLPAADFETWGHGFNAQAIQQSLISQDGDGKLIVGRGIPDRWLSSEENMKWQYFRLHGGEGTSIDLDFSGGKVKYTRTNAQPLNDVIIDIPGFNGSLKGTTSGSIVDNTVVLGKATTAATIDLYFLPYEAEDATLSGGAKVDHQHDDYSGLAYVSGYYQNAGASTTFQVRRYATGSGLHEFTLEYSAGAGAVSSIGVYVNGVLHEEPFLSATSDWNTYGKYITHVTLNKGVNTIEFRQLTSTTNVINLDRLKLEIL